MSAEGNRTGAAPSKRPMTNEATKAKPQGVAETVGSNSTKNRLKLYNEVVEKAELTAIQLLSLSFDSDLTYAWDYAPKSKLTYNVVSEETLFDSEVGKAAIFVLCDVKSKVGRKNALSCKAKFAVAYSGLSGCEEAAVVAFLQRVGRFSCYPYFRSVFATLDWNAQTRMPPLPVLKEPRQKSTKSKPQTE